MFGVLDGDGLVTRPLAANDGDPGLGYAETLCQILDELPVGCAFDRPSADPNTEFVFHNTGDFGALGIALYSHKQGDSGWGLDPPGPGPASCHPTTATYMAPVTSP